MKKIFGVFLCAMFCTAFVWAQEEEESDSMFEPSIVIENETTLTTTKTGDDEDTKGNVIPGGIGNETSAEFAVGIKLGETFSLSPYIKDKFAMATDDMLNKPLLFDANDFAVGLAMIYAPMDMLEITMGMGYLNRYKMFEYEGGFITPFFDQHGLSLDVGLGLNVESIFLEASITNNLEWLQGKTRYSKDDKKYTTGSELVNTFAVEMKMDFFNFIKEGLNSGLVLNNEMKLTKTRFKDVSDEEKWKWVGDKTIENEFAVGLHFAPLEFMDFTFLIKDAFEKKVAWIPDDSKSKYSDDYESSNKVILGLGLELKKNMFKFGIEYNPQLSGSSTVKAGDTTTTKKQKDMEHEVKLVVGIEL